MLMKPKQSQSASKLKKSKDQFRDRLKKLKERLAGDPEKRKAREEEKQLRKEEKLREKTNPESSEDRPKKGLLRKKKKHDVSDIPSVDSLEAELKREKYRTRYYSVLRSTIYALITVAAAAVLVATLWMPVLQIMGSSMTPTLDADEIVISIKSSGFETGDIVAFYHNNKLLIKRVIAGPGQWVDIDDEGNVYVDGELLEEPYIDEKAVGQCDIELPCQVPENRWFMIGDHRSVSIDSRSSQIGFVSEEMIVGKIVYRVWPITAFGSIK